jgi:phage recombination protein Bet
MESGRTSWTPEQVDLLKRTVAKGTTDDEFKIFLHVCKHTGLDPFMKQIYAIKRYDPETGGQTMAIQTGIDGFRLQAKRTKRYVPGREPTFVEGKDGIPISATAYVKVQADDGSWHEVAATALYAEYVQKKKDGAITRFWRTMPHGQLAKCAEGLVLRKCFPAEMSGLHTDDEMDQADNDAPAPIIQPRRASAAPAPAPQEPPITVDARPIEEPPAAPPEAAKASEDPAPSNGPEKAPDAATGTGWALPLKSGSVAEMDEHEVRPALEGVIQSIADKEGKEFAAILDRIASFDGTDKAGKPTRVSVRDLDFVFRKGTKWGRKLYHDAKAEWNKS